MKASFCLLAIVFVSLAFFSCAAFGDNFYSRVSSNLGDIYQLKDFEYETDSSLFQAIARRVGCEQASKLVVIPKSGSFPATIRQVLDGLGTSSKRSRATFYERASREFWDYRALESACLKKSLGSVYLRDHGFLKLWKYVKAYAPHSKEGVGLTVIAVGGLGSYMGNRHPLNDSMAEWTQLSKDRVDGSRLRFWDFVCSQYASDQYCAEELVSRVTQLEASEPSPVDQKYLFWGYSQGGNTILDALSRARELRNKTLGVVTVGSPVAGTEVSLVVLPVIDYLRTAKDQSPEKFEAYKLLLQGLLRSLSGGSPGTDMVGLLDDLDSVREAFESIHPAVRKQYLQSVFHRLDFSRDGGRPIPVFHVAGMLDISEMRGLPVFTTDGDSLALVPGSAYERQLFQLFFVPLFQRFPLSDTCVALEHAVLPKSVLPSGISTELVGVFNLDHGSFSFSNLNPNQPPLIDNVQMVDAILDVVAEKYLTQLIRTRSGRFHD